MEENQIEVKKGSQIEAYSILGEIVRGTVDSVGKESVFTKDKDSCRTRAIRKQTLKDQGYVVK